MGRYVFTFAITASVPLLIVSTVTAQVVLLGCIAASQGVFVRKMVPSPSGVGGPWGIISTWLYYHERWPASDEF